MKLTLEGKNVDLYSKYENEGTSQETKRFFVVNKTNLFKAKCHNHLHVKV
jgi:hypothetical protein